MDGLPSMQVKGTYKRLYRFRAWILLAGSLLSDGGNFRRDRWKEKAYSEIPLEIFSQMTTVAACCGLSPAGN